VAARGALVGPGWNKAEQARRAPRGPFDLKAIFQNSADFSEWISSPFSKTLILFYLKHFPKYFWYKNNRDKM
jgi:hypothetical protein